MDVPNSTPFPATFDSNAGDASPKQFFDFLRNLISENFDGDPSVCRPAPSRDTWVPVITSLSDHFLTPLPSHHAVPWKAMHEKVKLVEITLELIQRTTDGVTALYAGPGDLAKIIFAGLVKFCGGLAGWIDVEVPQEEGIPTPLELQQKAIQTAVGILRCLGNKVTSVAGSDEPTWKTLRDILMEGLEICRGAPSGSFSYPFLSVFMYN
jgi:serine/threonine-protein kinase ATR